MQPQVRMPRRKVGAGQVVLALGRSAGWNRHLPMIPRVEAGEGDRRGSIPRATTVVHFAFLARFAIRGLALCGSPTEPAQSLTSVGQVKVIGNSTKTS